MSTPTYGYVPISGSMPTYGNVPIGGPSNSSSFTSTYKSSPPPPMPVYHPPTPYQPPPPPMQLQQPYVSPNPIADFFCAPSHTTPWPHNNGYRR